MTHSINTYSSRIQMMQELAFESRQIFSVKAFVNRLSINRHMGAFLLHRSQSSIEKTKHNSAMSSYSRKKELEKLSRAIFSLQDFKSKATCIAKSIDCDSDFVFTEHYFVALHLIIRAHLRGTAFEKGKISRERVQLYFTHKGPNRSLSKLAKDFERFCNRIQKNIGERVPYRF